MNWFKIQKDNRGLSLVELVVAMAILSIITATIGGAMVVATNSYRQGTVESSLQQESQFTANLIESLIVDATKSVVAEPAITENADGSVTFPTTTKLTIKNSDEDYYIIKYDGKKLTYSEYAGGALVEGEADELLADHVSDFKVDARNFESARNVLLTIAMKNQKSEYKTEYNVTSRNNPNGGNSGVEAKTTINCASEIVMEPGQKYVLPVTVFGSANTYTAAFGGSAEGGSSLTVTPGGLEIVLDKNERGGGMDGDHSASTGFLTIKLTAQYADTKVITVYLRYVDKIAGKELNGNGAPSDTKEYTVNLSDIGFVRNDNPSGVEVCTNGFNLSKRASYGSDMGDYDYVDPFKVRWAVAANASDYVTVKNWDPYADSITFTIKKQLPVGATSTLFDIYALHPNGKENGTAMNKAAAYTSANPFGDDGHYRSANAVVGHVTYMVPNESGSDLSRGRLGYYTLFGGEAPNKALEKATVAMLKAKDPATYGSLTEDQLTVEPGLIKKYMVFARFQNADDPTDASMGYSSGKWRLVNGEGGVYTGTKTYGKVRQEAFLQDQNEFYMKFMATYNIDILTAVYYEYKLNGSSYGTWYPAELNNIYGAGEDDLDGELYIDYTGDENIVHMTMEPMTFKFSYIEVCNSSTNWQWVKVPDDDFNALLAALPGKDGLGSKAKPLIIPKDQAWSYKFRIEASGSSVINDGCGDTRGAYGISSLINKDKGPNPELVNCDDTSLRYPIKFQYDYDWDNNSDGPTDTIKNGAKFSISEMPNVPTKDADGHYITYRIEFNKFNGKGWEYYNAGNVDGKGQIYVEFHD